MAGKTSGRALFLGATSITELVQIIKSALIKRTVVEFGVRKEAGVSMERARKEANKAAIDLLDTLQPGAEITPEQRQILARYTGEGGIGGSEYEYYTPQHVAAGMWDLMGLYGADTGNCLEPSAGAGIFHEMKPRGVIMSATEISPISGKINQLLHPEDSVKIAPFETLAKNTPDDYYDSVMGNVPFGDSRGAFANLDPDYKDVQNIGHYFVLRTLDKLRPGGMACLILPYGMTSGSKHRKFREQVSRKAEFLGAHRLPSGTFNENGTATAVDIWVLRKHPEALADKILQLQRPDAEAAKVLWDVFCEGKWFLGEGKRFQHGEAEMQGSGKFQRMVIKNDQITNQELRAALANRFDSRINWAALEMAVPVMPRMVEGDKRYINEKWYRMENGRLVIDTSLNSAAIDRAKFGVDSYQELRTLTATPRGLLSLSFENMMNIAATYPETIPVQYQRVLLFAGRQKPKMRERAWRGSVIGLAVSDLQDMLAASDNDVDLYADHHLDLKMLVGDELERHGSPHGGGRVDVSGEGAGPWLRYKASITQDGKLSELVRGDLDRTTGTAYNTSNHEDVIRHLFNEISLDPVSLTDFRANFVGDLPENDDDLIALLAGIEGVAITAMGELMPFDRATSGDIGMMNSAIMAALIHTTDPRVKENYQKQLLAIKDKRKWTDVDSITFKLNSRWLDRRLVLEFLKERGYDELMYVADVNVEEGKLVSDLNYTGRDGVFVGYRYKTVMEKNKETGQTTPVYKRYTPADPFDAQLENYLNGAKYGKRYASRVQSLEEDFNVWIRQHDEIDGLVQQYNDAFNAYIPFEHSGASLGLTGISGLRIPMDYQNSEVRRVSEDGRGIIGFGTGLGKTTTAHALEAYNFENGRSKRTAYVVPKAVLENWYHESQLFYSQDVLQNFLFVGLNEVRGDDGKVRQVPVLDENGNPKMGNDGNAMMRNALTLASSAEIKERMNMIPQSNYRAVIMTKEQYAAIPLRIETIDEHAADVLYAQAEAGRVNLNGDKHSDAKRRNSIRAKAADTGTAKAEDFPYFEDMGFDSVIVDEGHNYRNSYSAGREAAALAYLPTGAQAKSAKDMAIKNAYLMKKNNGRGPVMLTATPLVNSPIDAFNMLSHVVPMEEWHRMGIHTPDDFVKVFGKTEMVNVQKLSGEIEMKEGLTGFLNLDGLRGIFHRWTTLKTAKDVSAQVKIPEVKEHTQTVPMTQQQADIYEELRERAQAMSETPPLDENGDEKILLDKNGVPIEAGSDSIFSVIRDMDRVCTDPDLYHGVITFRFPLDKIESVRALRADLPLEVKTEGDDLEEEDSRVSSLVENGVTVNGSYAQLVVPETFEKEVTSRLKKFSLDDSDISHPIPPKYAMLIEKLREGWAKGGKQIIFSDEKGQHEKLRRIIAAALPIDIAKIGILNATTVAEAAKGAKKPKRVKRPAEPKEDASADQLATYNEKMQDYNAYIAALNEISLGGLEQIASDYQEGRTPFLICNKKAEVGINLHLGTSDMHHLTLPWTPASIDQRNGRGARVGGTQDSVNAHYYCGEGSFDEFRLSTLKRKKNWITDILTSDKAQMDNADANSMEEMQLMLAADPEERERKRREQVARIEAIAREKAKGRAHIDMTNFIKAKHAAKGDPEQVAGLITEHQKKIERQTAILTARESETAELAAEQAARAQEVAELTAKGDDRWRISMAQDRLKRANGNMRDHQLEIDAARKAIAAEQDGIRKKERILTRIQKAASQIKRLRPELERAIKNGLIATDAETLDHADECYLGRTGTLYRKGQYYEVELPRHGTSSEYTHLCIARIINVDVDAGTALIQLVWSEERNMTLRRETVQCEGMLTETHFTDTEIDLKAWMYPGVRLNEVTQRLNESQFRMYLKSGDLRIREKYVLTRDGVGIDIVECMSGDSWRSENLNFKYGIDDWFKNQGHTIVWPDGNNDHLKTDLAKAFRERTSLDLAKAWFTSIYGEDYKTRMAEYGDKASPDDIADLVASTFTYELERREKESSNMRGTGSSQWDAYFDDGKPTAYLVDSVETAIMGKSWIPGNYTNTAEFKAAMTDYVNMRREELKRLVTVNAKARAADEYQKAIAASTMSVTAAIAQLDEMPYPTFTKNYLNGKGNADQWVELLSFAIALNLIDKAEINATLFIDPTVRYQIGDRINRAFSDRMSLDVDERWNDLRLKAGMVSQEEIDAAKARRAAIEKEQEIKMEVSTTSGIILKENQTTLLAGRYKNVKMPANQYWCLQDPEGKGGALFRAKDELKSTYSAYFYNGKNPDDECPGAWWLIKKNAATAEEIMAIINKY